MFKKVLGNLGLILFGVLFVSIASATTLTIPNSFSPNTTIQSALMNGNFSSIASWANGNIDSGNVGTNGINPSKILCISPATCTFGSAQDYIFPQAIILGPDASCPPAGVSICNDNAGTNGIQFTVPFTSSNGFQFSENSVEMKLKIGGGVTNFIPASGTVFNWSNVANTKNNMNLSDTGVLEAAPSIGGLQVLGQVAPIYGHTGTAVGGTAHTVVDTLSMSVSGNCLNNTLCTLTGNTVSFTNNAIFTSASTVGCGITSQNLGLGLTFNSSFSGVQLSVGLVNNTGSTINNATGEAIVYSCTGT